jgi:large subunit ribosomal protein L21
MSYSIIQIGSRQYKIEPGQIIEVDKLDDAVKTLSVDKVLLQVDEKNVSIGKPFLKEKIEFEVLETIKKDKIRVATYKAKSNYRRVIGQRRQMTRVKIMGVSSSDKKAVKKS